MDFIIAGAQKSATSWIYYNLRDHHSLSLPQEKKEKVYLGGDPHEEYDDIWYSKCLDCRDKSSTCGDVSVDYMVNPRSPFAVRDFAGAVKVFASLRSPCHRAVSAYFWNLRQGYVDEVDLNEGISRCIDTWERLNLETYDPDASYFNVIERGMYAKQLDRYIEQFGPESLHILYYNDICVRPANTLRRVFRSLEVDPDFKPPSMSRRPKQNSYIRPILWLERSLPNIPLFGKATDIANQTLCKLGLGREKPSLSPKIRDRLQSLYEPQNQQLEQLVQQLPRENILTPGSPVPLWIEEST